MSVTLQDNSLERSRGVLAEPRLDHLLSARVVLDETLNVMDVGSYNHQLANL